MPRAALLYSLIGASVLACRKAETPRASPSASVQVSRDSCSVDSILALLPVDGASIISERHAIDSARQRVRRNGDELTITLRNQTEALLRDCRREGDDYVRFRYQRYVSRIHSHLVEVSYYEGGSYLLVDDSIGRRVWLPSPPIFSPDSVRFLASSIDLEANYDPNVVQVWSIGRDSLSMEFKADGGNTWGPADPRWISPTTIQFWRTTIRGADLSHDSTLASLRLRDGSWQLVGTGP